MMVAEVVIVGGGTAGVAAAIAAARAGARTLIVERLGSLGGTQASGWVTPMMPNYLGDFKLDRGVNLEILARQTAEQPPSAEVAHGDVWYDPILLARVLDDLVQEAGAQCLFDATLISVQREGSRLRSIEVMTRGGAIRIEARAFVDAGGDAPLSTLAGAEIMTGDDETGEHQPMTLRFSMGGIDLAQAAAGHPGFFRFRQGGYLEAGFKELKESPFGGMVQSAIDAGILEQDDLGYFQCFTVVGRPGELAFNCPRLAGFDPLDPFQLSEAYRAGRQKIERIARFMRWGFQGFANAYISVVAPLIGIRESRRVVGEVVLTADDHLSCRKFPDAIARNRYPIDIHRRVGVDMRRFPEGEWHDIPYRCLVARGLDNLWMAGRCLSADFVAQSAVRIQPVCRSMGTAAGAAAALAAKHGWAARDVPYAELLPHLDLELPSSVA